VSLDGGYLPPWLIAARELMEQPPTDQTFGRVRNGNGDWDEIGGGRWRQGKGNGRVRFESDPDDPVDPPLQAWVLFPDQRSVDRFKRLTLEHSTIEAAFRVQFGDRLEEQSPSCSWRSRLRRRSMRLRP
jgi:hypothetical protein